MSIVNPECGKPLNEEACRNYYDLRIRAGRVISPGKFEGEPWQTVSAYDLAMEGSDDEALHWSSRTVFIFFLDPELRIAWDLHDPRDHAFVIELTGDGFVIGTTVTEAEYTDLIHIHQADLDDEYNESNH